MDKKERAARVVELLRATYPEVKGTDLNFETPLDLLVATILSAQCTDEKVNEVTRELFKRYGTAEDYAEADLKVLEEIVRPTGFHTKKAEYIKRSCQKLVEEHDSKVPGSMAELTKLHGVARKTANIILSNALGIVEGIAVDTHVIRVSRRLGLTGEKYREKIEADLMDLLPKAEWFDFSNLLIAHGRKICVARNPRCAECVLNGMCPSAFTFS